MSQDSAGDRPCQRAGCPNTIPADDRKDKVYCSSTCRALAHQERNKPAASAQAPPAGPGVARPAAELPLPLPASTSSTPIERAGPGPLVSVARPHSEATPATVSQPAAPLEMDAPRSGDSLRREFTALNAAHAQLTQQYMEERERANHFEEKHRRLTELFNEEQKLLGRFHAAALLAEKELAAERNHPQVSQQAHEDLRAAYERRGEEVVALKLELARVQQEATELRSQLEAAQRKVEELGKAYEAVRPQDDGDDRLLQLMKDKAWTQDSLGEYLQKQGKDGSRLRLPYPDPRSALEVARKWAIKARREFYHSRSSSSQARWIHEDRLLDPKSEEEIYKEQDWQLQRLRGDLDRLISEHRYREESERYIKMHGGR